MWKGLLREQNVSITHGGIRLQNTDLGNNNYLLQDAQVMF